MVLRLILAPKNSWRQELKRCFCDSDYDSLLQQSVGNTLQNERPLQPHSGRHHPTQSQMESGHKKGVAGFLALLFSSLGASVVEYRFYLPFRNTCVSAEGLDFHWHIEPIATYNPGLRRSPGSFTVLFGGASGSGAECQDFIRFFDQ